MRSEGIQLGDHSGLVRKDTESKLQQLTQAQDRQRISLLLQPHKDSKHAFQDYKKKLLQSCERDRDGLQDQIKCQPQTG